MAASFVIPYPPGFPILVPGQVLSEEILEFFIKLDVKEIHGYRPEMGLRVFTNNVLNRQKMATTAMMANGAYGAGMGHSTQISKKIRKKKIRWLRARKKICKQY